MKNAVQKILVTKKQYTPSRTEIHSVRIATNLLNTSSGNITPIVGGDIQENSW